MQPESMEEVQDLARGQKDLRKNHKIEIIYESQELAAWLFICLYGSRQF